ncbi:MAG TPA: hypothetical protein VMD53_17435, partial [Rhizomicrobium sp.]|nr:hypothetical protein [Rhizomicrobium sp.]
MTGDLTLIDGKLHLYKREGSPRWQCSAYVGGRNHRHSTKTDDIERAKLLAEEWYFSLRLKERAGDLVRGGHLFSEAAAKFFPEYQALTAGERNPRYVDSMQDRLRVHLLPFFGNTPVSQITSGMVQDYRVHRMTSRKDPHTGEIRRPARSTLHHEIVTLRHVLKTAERLSWIKYLPNLAAP